MVSFRYDAPELSPAETALALAKAVSSRDVALDSYSIGGAVAELEAAMAARLGKERAVFMPTGTLANHLAIRALAVGGRRILVQERSHIYNDVGDSLSDLSGLSLIPLGHRRASFSLVEAEEAWDDSSDTRVKTGIGALSIETPVRRCDGAIFDFGEMAKVTAWARERNIGTHLDGARLFIASHYSKESVKECAALFDTVYVSLYKYFGAPSGALVAGPAKLLDGIYHERRMFGGGLNQAWPFACLALDALPRFDEDFAQAVRDSEAILSALAGSELFAIERVPSGSNIFILRLRGEGRGSDEGREAGESRHGRFVEALAKRRIAVPKAHGGAYHLKVNASLLESTPAEIASAFLEAAKDS